MDTYFAHTSKNGNELLEHHLRLVADLAEQFANEFQSGKVGRQMGLLHDVGKHTEKFQRVLKNQATKINHAIVGAIVYADGISDEVAADEAPDDFIWSLICNSIYAHHSYLSGELYPADLVNYFPIPDEFDAVHLATDDDHKENALSSIDEYYDVCNYALEQKLIIKLTDQDYLNVNHMSYEDKLIYARMLFSCLVDADYSATASVDDPKYLELVGDIPLDPDALLKKLDIYRNKLIQGTDQTSGMNYLRGIVYRDATIAGSGGVGLYTLTAPTGTAKTLALIKFALEQAKCNVQKRIFVVLPYLSIISQNARIYREIFGNDVVLEDDSQTEYADGARTYADRWNAPVIVTTSVKFFETLMSAKATDLRKLHSIVNSVVVFDESQTLPCNVTDISIRTLISLTQYFGTTVLLSTATQPAYEYRKQLNAVAQSFKEIIQDTPALFKNYNAVKNTSIVFSTDKTWTNEDLTEYFSDISQVLYVFNTTKKALAMYEMLLNGGSISSDALFLLTSAFCSEHKLEIIAKIRKRLSEGSPCYVCSTQCIEAGVDFDFPCGAREYAPFSSIVQTAGRINRNGKGHGRMLVFMHDKSGRFDFPGTDYKNQAGISYCMAEQGKIDTNDPKVINEYYRMLFSGDSQNGSDGIELVNAVHDLNIKEVSDNYSLIEDENQITVLVPYDKKRDAFDVFCNRVRETEYVFYKKDMRECRGFAVTAFSSKKNLEFVNKHCHHLLLHTHFGAQPTNWFIADMDSIYDDKTGLSLKEEEGDLVI